MSDFMTVGQLVEWLSTHSPCAEICVDRGGGTDPSPICGLAVVEKETRVRILTGRATACSDERQQVSEDRA